MNHLALGVPSVADGYDTVVKRGLNPEKPKIGRDGKWQLNLYGPDQTRVELMEPKPVQTARPYAAHRLAAGVSACSGCVARRAAQRPVFCPILFEQRRPNLLLLTSC